MISLQAKVRTAVEVLEGRTLLSGNVEAVLAGGLLSITGDAQNNSIVVSTKAERVAGQAMARGGTTSVYLDTELLAAAANLNLSGANTTGRPAGTAFQVGFPILKTTDFAYTVDPFAPVSGKVTHSGTVSFNGNTITVGNFDIGFDAGRVGGARSGFYVADTVSGLGTLFDVGVNAQTSIESRSNRLNISNVDLLVSAEFAGLLQSLGLASADLTGADVGNAQVNARSGPVIREYVSIWGDGTMVNGQSAAWFPADEVQGITAALGDGDDRIWTGNVKLQGDVRVDAGAGDDSVLFSGTRIGGDLTVLLGDGPDYLNLLVTNVGGTATLDGESGRDTLVSLFSRFGSRVITGFESRLVI